MGVEVARDMREGLNGADIVMMLRLQRERMNGSFVPSSQVLPLFRARPEEARLCQAGRAGDAPGPMNRGVEIDSIVADGAQSLIREQVRGSGGADGGARSARHCACRMHHADLTDARSCSPMPASSITPGISTAPATS